MAGLTQESLNLLLKNLDDDPSKAELRYLELRSKLESCLGWKGCPESEAPALVDEIFDRVATKLLAGEEIKNIDSYACGVLRFVWLEHSRKYKEDAYGDDTPEVAVYMEQPEEPDQRIACLRSCLIEIAPDDKDRKLILEYYDNEDDSKLKNKRKTLAEKFGVSMNTLKVRAFRLREKLEKCITECMEKRRLPVTK